MGSCRCLVVELVEEVAINTGGWSCARQVHGSCKNNTKTTRFKRIQTSKRRQHGLTRSCH